VYPPCQVLERLHSLAEARSQFIARRVRDLSAPGAVGAQLLSLRNTPVSVRGGELSFGGNINASA
jgi:hypothetical protein